MNFDPTWLFLSLIPSGIGFVLFVYGKKQERWPHLLAGIVFSIYPYFTPSIAVDGGGRRRPWSRALAGGARRVVTSHFIRSLTSLNVIACLVNAE